MSMLPIAVVGIATDLPSGDHSPNNLTHEEFHDFLLAKKDSYTRIPDERMNVDAWAGRGLGQVIAGRGSFLKHVGMFDPTEFGIAAKDARAMAVSTRKLVELSFLALLDSGIDYRGQNVGCYASGNTFDMQSIAEPDEMEPRGSLAGIPCMIANKISYHLDLRGPSIPVDTACSSSAVAMHMAVQALRSGECDSAVVAGCQLNLRASDFALYTQASILSPDGKCKPFDAGGNGFSRGEGAVVAVLKRLDRAINDGDHIYGTVLGTGVSSCGSMAPVNAPVADAQANAMERAYAGSGRKPSDVDYVEVHGTGTAAGDPTEANWVGERFARSGELLIGSVKGNIGHLEITSFLASLSKVLSIFSSGHVQPNVHLTKRNPAIRWDELKIRVALQPEPISARASSGKLLASICSSGIGGVNAHAVVESHPPSENVSAPAADVPALIIAGGLSPRSTAAVGEDIKQILATDAAKATDYSVIYGRRARQMTWQSFAVKRPGVDSATFSPPVLAPKVKPPVLFLFAGQGPQHVNMGRQLFQMYPVFRRSVLELDACYKSRMGTSLIDDVGLFGDFTNKTLPSVWPISLILPTITVVQLALFDLLISFGLTPDILIGHSAGETALLYASGAGSKEMALEISVARGEAMTIVEENSEGTMAAVACSVDDASRILQSVCSKATDKTVEIACYNSPEAVALAGHTVLIDEAIALATKEGFMGRKIMTRVPVHCSLMELCKAKFKDLVGDVFARYPGEHRTKIKTYSTCTGDVLDAFTADYFWQNSRHAVQFTMGMGNLLAAHSNPVVVEMSPHPVLASYVTELGISSSSIVGPMRRSKVLAAHQEQTALLTAMGQLVVAGGNKINFNLLQGRPKGATAPRATVPAYPFTKKHVDYFPELSRVIYRQMSAKNGPLNFPDLRINVATHPELADHMINSEPIMPAAGFIEMGLEFGAKTLWNIRFHSILALSAPTPTPVEVRKEGSRYTVKSRPQGATKYFNHDESTMRLHADGYLSTDVFPTPGNVNIAEIRIRGTVVDIQEFYDSLKYFAQYGPSFRRVDQLFVGEREALVRIKGTCTDLTRDGKYILHPAILDSTFHACVHPALTKSTDPNIYFLPAKVNSINVYETMNHQAFAADHVYAHVTFQLWQPSEITYDIALLDMHGRHLCTLEGFAVARHLQFPLPEVTSRFELTYQPYGISPREFTISSKELAPETVLDLSRELVKHFVETCGKKVLKVLELHSSEAPLMGSNLVQCFDNFGAVFPSYTVASKNIKSIPSDSLPSQHSVIEVDASGSDISTKLDPASFDLIIGAHEFGTTQGDLKRLKALLTPGAFLLISAPSSSACPQKFEMAGFENILVSEGGKKSVQVLIVAQASVLPVALPAYQASNTKLTIIPYAVGREMDVQAKLKKLDETYQEAIWIIASEGLDADSLAGFGRTLTKEFPQWNIRLASFRNSYSERDRKFIIENYLPHSGAEREFVIEQNLVIQVPRIVPSPSPKTSIRQIRGHSISLREGEVFLDVMSSSFSDTGLWGVVGKVREIQAGTDSYLLGRTVVAVTKETPLGIARLHNSCIALVPRHVHLHALASVAPSLILCGAALGAGVVNDPTRLRSRIIITHAKEQTGHLLWAFCEKLGASVKTLESNFTPREVRDLKLQSSDIVFTAAGEANQVLTSYIPEGTRVVVWKSIQAVTALIQSDPWIVRDVLQACMKLPNISEISSVKTVNGFLPEIPSKVTDIAAYPNTAQLFSPEKAYLLVGGVGSLGPSIALWMYQRGARHIVLTSRSGRGTLDRMADSLPSRLLHYLEHLPDLSLGVEAADSSDVRAVRKLVDGLSAPLGLGGCIFLAAIFDDRFFFSQDRISFKRSFSSKVGVMDALEAVVDINKLDFVISLSSGTIWGNAGQTNYTSANTALDGKLRKYPNAFSIAAPAIFDTTSMSGTNLSSDAKRASHLNTWACSPQGLCNYLEDGLLKLLDEPFHVYVPTVDFNVLAESLGSSHLYDHMIKKSESSQAVEGEDLHDALQSLVLQFVDVSPGEFSAEVPLTTYGLDSLSAGRLSFALKPYIVLSQMQLLGDMSLQDLEARIAKAQDPSHNQASDDTSKFDSAAAAADIDRMVEKFSLGLGEAKRFSGPLITNSVVLITGTTGGLGSYFLAQLIKDKSVTRIYAFNRPSSVLSTLERQRGAFKDRDLDTTLLRDPKLVFVDGDASANGLGIEKYLYETIKQSVTVIVHNAWQLDLNSPLKAFIPNISATRNLVDLGLSSPKSASLRFAFISSIASTQGWKDMDKSVPEELQHDSQSAVLYGYGEGKYVAEKIIAASGLQSSTFRVGQLCGAADSGAWAVTEWVPMIVKSSITMNAIPDAGGVISWIAMDKVAPIVLDVVLSKGSPPVTLNLVHPRPILWHTMMVKINEGLLESKTVTERLPMIAFTKWISALENKGKSVSAEESQQLPALKLLDRLRIFADGCPPLPANTDETQTREAGGWPRLTLDRILAASPTMRKMQEESEMIGDLHVHAWINYWKEKGLRA